MHYQACLKKKEGKNGNSIHDNDFWNISDSINSFHN